MMQPEPVDPFGPLVEATTGLHELFVSLVAADFTEDQALHMVTAVILQSIKPDAT